MSWPVNRFHFPTRALALALALGVPGVASADALGWLWHAQPTASAQAPAAYSYNSAGGANRVDRVGVGVYRAVMPGIPGGGGSVQVAAYGSSARCKVAGWGGTDLTVQVRCHDAAGRLVDSRFVVQHVAAEAPSGVPGEAYLWTSSTASHVPPARYALNSTGRGISMARLALGRYQVTLEGQSVAGGTVHVTAYGADPAWCQVAGWSTSGGATRATVHCYTTGGAATDSLFTLRYRNPRAGTPESAGYAWADRSVLAYVPSPTYQYNSAGLVNEAGRSAVGSSFVRFPGLPATDSTAMVTAYGSVPGWCTPSYWTGGADRTEVRVSCFDAAGRAADLRYTVSMRNAPTQYRVLEFDGPTAQPTVEAWSGTLRLLPAARLGRLERLDFPVFGRRVVDGWYRTLDGDLAKVVVDSSRRRVGQFVLGADGAWSMSLDLDGDGIVDLLDVISPDGIRRMVVEERLGRGALDAFLLGENPLCVPGGVPGLSQIERESGLMAGCGRAHRSQDFFSGLGKPRPGETRPSWTDPLDLICQRISPRALMGFDVPVYGDENDSAAVLRFFARLARRGLDGEVDSEATQTARFYVLVLPALFAAAVAHAVDAPAESPPAEGGSEGGEEPAEEPEPPVEERPGDPGETLPEMLVQACRDDGRSPADQAREVLRRRCLAPDDAESGVCVDLEPYAGPQGGGGVSCIDHHCEPATAMDRLRATYFDGAPFELVELCNPMVCRPL